MKEVKGFQQNFNPVGKNLLQKMAYKTLHELRVSVIGTRSKRIIFGDSIRVEKISESIDKAGFQVLDVRFPLIDRNNLSTYEGLKKYISKYFSST